MESGNGGNGGNIGGRFGRDGMRFGLNGKGMEWNMVHDRQPMKTSKNPETWEHGHPCPISQKPHKFTCGGNYGNLQKPTDLRNLMGKKNLCITRGEKWLLSKYVKLLT